MRSEKTSFNATPTIAPTSVSNQTLASQITAAPKVTNSTECGNAWSSYFEQFMNGLTRMNATTVTDVWETRVSVGNSSLYTACDGIPRLKWNASPTITTTSLVSVVSILPAMWSKGPDKNSPQPSCKPDWEFCRELEHRYNTDKSWYPNARWVVDVFLNYCLESRGRLKDICTLWLDDNEIVLLHWEGTLASEDTCDGSNRTLAAVASDTEPVVITTDAITFRGGDLARRAYITSGKTLSETKAEYVQSSVLSGPFTFTSPSVYIAHRAISAYYPDSADNYDVQRGKEFTILPDGVMALRQEDVYSGRPIRYYTEDSIHHAQLVAMGKFQPNPDLPKIYHETVPFNFANLIEPIPADAYFDARYKDCYGIRQTHCATITEDSYRPWIALKDAAWNSIVGKHSQCLHPVLNDPPIILRITSSLDVPTIPALATAAVLQNPSPQLPSAAILSPFRGPTAITAAPSPALGGGSSPASGQNVESASNSEVHKKPGFGESLFGGQAGEETHEQSGEPKSDIQGNLGGQSNKPSHGQDPNGGQTVQETSNESNRGDGSATPTGQDRNENVKPGQHRNSGQTVALSSSVLTLMGCMIVIFWL
jgi:hypothetical protein